MNAATGEYLLPPLDPRTICSIAEGQGIDAEELRALRAIYRAKDEKTYGVSYGTDPTRLEEAGWGVVLAGDAPMEGLLEALSPLLVHRRNQAGKRYREFTGGDGYHLGESSFDFLARFGAGPGPVRPEKVPYYLLLVGSPSEIPFGFQYQLDVIHAVGRVCFETLEEYRSYAEAVIRGEARARRKPRVGFFGPRNVGDVATRRSADHLVGPLADELKLQYPPWEVDCYVADQASKSRLARMLGGDATPDLVFTASHGVGFPYNHPEPLQAAHQGALLCQDWPGPLAELRAIPPEQYFSADDICNSSNVEGLLAFFFACYGVGTPSHDDFAPEGSVGDPLAPQPFVARLPQRLLSRGALAVVGHVDRAWGYSFSWPRAGAQIEVFRSTLACIMEGHPVGLAIDHFNERYAQISAELSAELYNRTRFGKMNDVTVAGLWTANNDARNYTVFGDPAVNLNITISPR